MAVLKLSREKWQKFKQVNELSKSTIFNRADVGPSIETFSKDYKAFQKTKSLKLLLQANHSLQKLQTAFTKFIAIKELKAELKTGARSQIEKWHEELNAVSKDLAKYVATKEKEAKLAKKDIQIQDDILAKIFVEI